MGIFVFGLAGLLQCYSEFRDLFSGVMVICEMRKFERVFCETTCETLCDWSIGRRVFRRLPVAVVVAATGAAGVFVLRHNTICIIYTYNNHR